MHSVRWRSSWDGPLKRCASTCSCVCVCVCVCVHVGQFPPQVYERYTFLLEQYHKAFLQQQT